MFSAIITRIVDKAAMAQFEKGNCMPLPGLAQVELAELLCDTIAIADWAFFMKNGGDATGFARMIAHAATGRDKVVMVEGGYHGVAPWTQPLTHAGITPGDVSNNLVIGWNDADAFEKVVQAYPGQIAAFISTPYDHRVFTDNVLPADGYWKKIRKICDDNGIVLIVDDVRCGFRLNNAGSAEYFDFKPDLACYCKALANGL